MSENTANIQISDIHIPIYSCNTLVVGSGAAAFNAADSLYDLGQTDVAIVTEGVNMGTSRNTGSDKQTYFKLSLSSSSPDSVFAMAQVLHSGESVHGDTALVEAALSARSFYKLVNLGVPFPHDKFGQYVGYKTDHDLSQRATSCGPLTSRYMTEKLEQSIARKNIPVYEGYRIVQLLTQEVEGQVQVVGALAVVRKSQTLETGFALFRCTNIVYGVGGPSGLYYNSVFPQSQTCGHGAAFLCGAQGNNVGEWQYGIASTKFRWNLSGTYQQVIPRYVSTEADGSDPQEFLMEYFQTPSKMLDAVFLKGYQWPFDPRKTGCAGSSLVDIAVYTEIQKKGRRVFLDYTKNPSVAEQDGSFDFSLLGKESHQYLEKSGVLFGTPLERLLTMNRPAYELYFNHGIDLKDQWLEIAVCAQHNNGGLKADIWWQSNVKHLFPVGEACGNFGVYRPGGSALNAGQVGSLRAAQYIAKRGTQDPLAMADFSRIAKQESQGLLDLCQQLMAPSAEKEDPRTLRTQYQKEMDGCAAFLRNANQIDQQIQTAKDHLAVFAQKTQANNTTDLINALINRDILVTQIVYLTGMKAYIDDNGGSRGSYLIDRGDISYDTCVSQGVQSTLDDGAHGHQAQEIAWNNGDVTVWTVPCRAMPSDECWFEDTYNTYLNDQIVGY